MRAIAIALAGLAGLASPAVDARGAAPYRIGPVDAIVEPAPCRGALVLRTVDGAHFEIDATIGLYRGRRLRAGGMVHPWASRCRRYPWLRIEFVDGVRAPPGIDLEESIPHRLAEAAAAATERAEAHLPVEPTRWLELDVSGPLVPLRALLRMLLGAGSRRPAIGPAIDARLTPAPPRAVDNDESAPR